MTLSPEILDELEAECASSDKHWARTMLGPSRLAVRTDVVRELIQAARAGILETGYVPMCEGHIHRLEKENQALRELLREVEWAGDFNDDPACPVCLSRAFGGHAPGCKLAKALGDGE